MQVQAAKTRGVPLCSLGMNAKQAYSHPVEERISLQARESNLTGR